MPDISLEAQPTVEGRINAVGMREIEMPIFFKNQKGEKLYQKAKIDAFVSLDESKAKGIHMSRLYSVLQKEFQRKAFSLDLIKKVLMRFVESQDPLSFSSRIRVQLDWPILRKSLKSQNFSWKYYPFLFEGEYKKKGPPRGAGKKIEHQRQGNKNEEFDLTLGSKIYYSSTCPCSAALSQDLIQSVFLKGFKNRRSLSVDAFSRWLKKPLPAVPHAQRSLLKFKVKWLKPSVSRLILLIDKIEKILGTPVQLLVKKEDEQEFARLNANHLMFCEDAARKVKFIFEKEKGIKDYVAFVEHFESLHPHTATSLVFKGVKEGFNYSYIF